MTDTIQDPQTESSAPVAKAPANPLAAVIKHKEQALAELVGADNLKRFTGNVLSQLKAKNAQGKPNKLLECTPASFYAAAYQAALLGLQPGPLDECYLVPYGREATLIVGYKGMIAAALRHPRVKNVHAEVVYKGDHYVRNGGTGEIEHHPKLETERTENNIIGAYCWVSYHDTDEKTSLDLNLSQIKDRQLRSAAPNGNFWKNDFPAMARKSVVRALFEGGEVPRTRAMEQIIGHEREEEKLADVEGIRDAEPEPPQIEAPKNRSEAVLNRIRPKPQPEVVVASDPAQEVSEMDRQDAESELASEPPETSMEDLYEEVQALIAEACDHDQHQIGEVTLAFEDRFGAMLSNMDHQQLLDVRTAVETRIEAREQTNEGGGE